MALVAGFHRTPLTGLQSGTQVHPGLHQWAAATRQLLRSLPHGIKHGLLASSTCIKAVQKWWIQGASASESAADACIAIWIPETEAYLRCEIMYTCKRTSVKSLHVPVMLLLMSYNCRRKQTLQSFAVPMPQGFAISCRCLPGSVCAMLVIAEHVCGIWLLYRMSAAFVTVSQHVAT